MKEQEDVYCIGNNVCMSEAIPAFTFLEKKRVTVLDALSRVSDIESVADVEESIFTLAQGVVFASLVQPWEGNESENRIAVEKLFDACDRVLALLADAPEDVRASPVGERAYRLLTSCAHAASRYLTGEVWAVMPVDVGDKSATLDTRDVRSTHRRLGLSHDIGERLPVRSGLHHVTEYHAAGIFGPHTIEFLIAGVPADVVHYFFSLFSRESYHAARFSVPDAGIAQAIMAAPHDYEYLAFMARLLRNRQYIDAGEGVPVSLRRLYPDLAWANGRPSVIRALYLEWRKDMARVEGLLEHVPHEYNIANFSLSELLKLLRTTHIDGERLAQDVASVGDVLSLQTIVRIYLAGGTPKTIASLLRRLPEIMRIDAVFEEIARRKNVSHEALIELGTYYDNDVDGETCSREILWWYIENREHARAHIAHCRARKVFSVHAAYVAFTDSRLRPKEWLAYASAIREPVTFSESESQTICEWKEDGVTPSDIVKSRGVWDDKKGVPWSVIDAVTIRQYIDTQRDHVHRETMRYVCTMYDKVPSEIVAWVQEGYVQAHFDSVVRYGFGINSATLFLARDYPEMLQRIAGLSEDERIHFERLTLREMRASLARGVEITEICSPPAEQVVKILGRKNAYGALLEHQSPSHEHYCALFEMCGVSPEYMEEQVRRSGTKKVLDDVLVNHIILCAYADNRMPAHVRVLVEKYRISFFTRYPKEVLASMCAPEQDESKEVCVVLQAKSDHNNFSDGKVGMYTTLARNRRVVVYEVATKADMYSALREEGEHLARKGKKIQGVVYAGHGGSDLVQMGYPYSRTSTELAREAVPYFTPLRQFVASDAQLVLASCSTGREDGEEKSLARTWAETWPGVEVFAANKNTGVRDIEFTDGRVSAVQYTEPNTQVVFRVYAMPAG